MNSYDTTLADEIAAKLRAFDATGVAIIDPRYITSLVMADHRTEDWDLATHAYWEHCAYSHTRRMVADQIKGMWGDDIEDAPTAQLRFPGFESVYLYARYIVERDGERVAVHVQDMTDAEIDAKARLYEQQAKTMLAHAEELRRYALARAVTTAPAQ